MTSTMKPKDAIEATLPIVCEPQSIPPHERETWLRTARETYAAVEAVHELPDGYALRLDPSRLVLVAEYVSLDRLCCKYVRWSILVEEGGGPLWLSIRGPEGTKTMSRQTFEQTDLLPIAVAQAAGFATSSRTPVDRDTVMGMAERPKA